MFVPLKLAPVSRAKIRNGLSMIFRHGMRWDGWKRIPVSLVRCSSKRLHRPDVLTAEDFQTLLGALPTRERLMGTICATTGLWIGEVLGLKWKDIDLSSRLADVLHSYSEALEEREVRGETAFTHIAFTESLLLPDSAR